MFERRRSGRVQRPWAEHAWLLGEDRDGEGGEDREAGAETQGTLTAG